MPEGLSLAAIQNEFAAHIRNPAEVATPADIETRRMKIYTDLIYNNVEGFISGGFPVTRSLFRDEDWHGLIRTFLRDYRCHSPYFLEISQEFLQFLMQTHQPRPLDPPFLAELAHYEWVELALDVAVDSIPPRLGCELEDLMQRPPQLSPLAWSLQYCYPVHLIGPGMEPEEAPLQPTFLIVYRNRDEAVKFMESNAATARLLELVRDNSAGRSGQQLLEQLAEEMNSNSVTSILDFGSNMLRQLHELDIVTYCASPA